jgi:hypothetical protein
MKSQEGYVLIDHRASPGTSEVPEGTLFETATLHCAHCPSIVIVNPGRTRERAECMKCGYKYICDNCALEARLPDYVHKPHQEKMQELYRKITTNG